MRDAGEEVVTDGDCYYLNYFESRIKVIIVLSSFVITNCY